MLPYMGQGASSAIEDGVVLGRCFAIAAEPDEALALYERARVKRCAFLQAESNAGGDRLQALDPYVLRDSPPQNEDALGIFSYDPTRVELA
jgi:salicylate hydroxylase